MRNTDGIFTAKGFTRQQKNNPSLSLWLTWRHVTTVSLSHSSVPDYLVSANFRTGAASCYSFSINDTHDFVISSCLRYLQERYLCFGHFRRMDKYYRMVKFHHISSQMPLYAYAAKHWNAHASERRAGDPQSWTICV